MRLHDLSLVTRVTIGVLGIVVSGAVTLLIIENVRDRDAYLSEQHAHLEKALESEELRLNQTINTLRQDALFLSNTPPVSGIVRAALNHGYGSSYGNTHKVWTERLQQIFSAFSKAHPDYYKIRFIGVADGGREIVRIDNRGGKIEITSSDRLQAKGDRDFFKATLGLHEGQVHLSKFNLNQDWGVIEQPYRPTLRAATPVFTPSGKIFGMVMINIDANNLLKPSVLSLPQNTQVYIANGDGQYLFHPDSQRTFAFELGSKDNIATDFPGLKMMLNPQAADYMAPQAIKTGTGSALIAARRIHFDPSDPAHFLFLMYSIPDTVVAQHIPMMPLKNIIGGFIIILLVGGMALLVLRRTFAPLAYITAAADKIAAGEQDIRLPQAGGGEIGSLTSALNAMLARLSQRDKLLRESEIRYRRLHESMMDAFVMVDMSGRLLDSNRIFREMLGYSTDELQRLTYIDLTPEKWHEFEARIIKEQIIPNGYSQVYEKECIRKDGTVFPVELKTFLLRDASNQPEAMWTIVRDIAERKLTEKALARSEERARLAISASHLALWDYDLGTGSVYLSEGWSQLLGGELQPTFTTIQELTELVPEEDQYMVRTAIMEAVKGHVSSSYQVKHRVRKLDGGYIWVLSEGHVIDRDRDDRALRMIGTNRDITQSKQLEEAKQEALDRLQKIASQVPGVVYQFRMRPDSSFSFPFASEALREIFRVSPEQVLEDASPVFAVVHPDDLAATLDSILVSARNQSPWRHEARIKFDDGTMHWLFGNALPQREADGSVLWHGFITDITERKQAEEAITKAGEKFHMLFDSISDAIFITGMDGRFIQVNRSACESLGYSQEELLQMGPADIDTPEYAAKVPERVRALQERGKLVFESAHVRRDGVVIPIELSSRIIDYDGKPTFMSVARDITERKRAGELLRKSSEEIEDLYNHAPCGYHSLDKDGIIRRINDTELAWLGYTQDEVIGRMNWTDLITPTSLQTFWGNFPKLKEHGFARDLEIEMIRKDGTVFVGLVNATAIYDTDGNFMISRSMVADITERKAAEQEMRDLSMHLQAVREEEKTSIAREIHDDLGGTLTALKVDIYWLTDKLTANKGTAPLLEHVKSMSQLIDNAVCAARRVISDLRPTVLDDLGLRAALEWQCAQFQQRTGIEYGVNCLEDKGKLDKQYSIALFRIFQEALTNISRHSGATRVEIEFHHSDEEVVLSIIDNGRGMPEGNAISSSSYGIRGMRERAEQLNGKIKFDIPPGGGFSVTVILPLPANNKKKEKT